MLVDTFVNAIFVYDDKLLLTFNFKDGTKTITLADTETIADENGSDLEMFGVPKQYNPNHIFPIGSGFGLFVYFS